MITVDEFIDKYLGMKMGTEDSVCFRWVKQVLEEDFGFVLRTDYLEMLGSFKDIRKPHPPKFGDIVLMRTHPSVPNHVGIYLRKGKFAHCGIKKEGEIILSDIRDPHYGERIVAFLRPR